ncbi:MAG: sulfotransferase [Myxococcales bacterium]|nr:MAG: sulfotransferase [Myxococcales bacterium]
MRAGGESTRMSIAENLKGAATAAGSESPNPYVFLVGCPRSGTTLAKRMLDAHPRIAITRETHWITRFFRKHVGLTDDGMVTPALLDELLAYKRFPHLHLDEADVRALVTAEKPMRYTTFVSAVFDLYGLREGKPLVGDKTPPYVRYVGMLSEMWPRARFVHIIRDGRDVCLSMLKWRMADRAAGRRSTWEEDPVTTTALWWEWLIRLGREAGEPLGPDRYYEMKYETLVADPPGELATLCKFLELPYDDVMLRYHEGRTSSDAKLSANAAWLPPTQGLRDWRNQMSPEDLENFEAAAGTMLTELGYEHGAPAISPAAQAHARDLRRRFDGKPLPKNWSTAG